MGCYDSINGKKNVATVHSLESFGTEFTLSKVEVSAQSTTTETKLDEILRFTQNDIFCLLLPYTFLS